jgi:murein DD-endopeptidase MepM/ murein hydrolase activator NlpD
MIQIPNSVSTPRQFFTRFLLIQGLGWISTIGVLNGGVVLAQTASEASPVDAAPIDSFEIQVSPEANSQLELPPSSTAPLSLPESAEVPSIAPNESFIDSTQYSIGATSREPEPAAVPAWQNPSTVGTIVDRTQLATADRASSAGYGITSGVAGRTTAAARYYYRTARPPGRLGNGNISLIFPLPIPAPITSVFGWRVHPISGDRRFHSGTDIGAPLGTPVLATYAGRVAIADFLDGYGLTVALQHNKDTQETLYAHLSEIFVKPGEWIEQGTVIGRVGSTGNSTGPHLHFEFRQLSADGWVALDAGTQLEFAMAQLVKALQTAQANPKSANAS